MKQLLRIVLPTLIVGCGRVAPVPTSVVVYDFVRNFPYAALGRTDPVQGKAGDGTGGAVSPGVETSGNGLRLPAGSRIDYFLRLPPRGRIAFDEIASDDPQAVLRITLRQAGGEDIVLGAPARTTDRWEAAIPADERWPIARLSFAAIGPGPTSAGLLLRRPVIEMDLSSDAPRRDHGPADPPPFPANVIIYMTDAMRADHLGCYRYERPTSPNIDQFAEQGMLFENAIAQAPWTTSSVASMLTGVYPATHRLTLPQHALPASLITLGEILNGAGYMTAAFITNSAAGEAFGLARGFSHHRLLRPSVDRKSIHQLSDRLNEELFSWLDGRDDDRRPLFLYLHATDTHSPYTPPPQFAGRFFEPGYAGDFEMPADMPLLADPGNPPPRSSIEKLIGLYDAEVAFNDQNFGRFLDGLRDRGLYDDSLILFLSDHGEEFYEHGGWQHMRAVYGESVRIPFIVKLPAGTRPRRGRTETLAQQVDVLPTVLALIGIDSPPQAEGRDLIAALDRPGGGRPARAFSYFDRRERTGFGVVDGSWKMIRVNLRDRPSPPPELYDLEHDPGEKRDLAADQPEVLGYLRSVLAQHLGAASGLAAEDSVIDEELRRELKALGYLD